MVMVIILLASGCLSLNQTKIKWTVFLPGGYGIVDEHFQSIKLVPFQMLSDSTITLKRKNGEEWQQAEEIGDSFVIGYWNDDSIIALACSDDPMDEYRWKSKGQSYFLIDIESDIITVYENQWDIETELKDKCKTDRIEWTLTFPKPAEAK